MKLIIDIPEEMWTDINSNMGMTDLCFKYLIRKILKNGTPLTESDDCISRQAVLDLIEHYNSDGLGALFYGYDEGLKFTKAVNKLPSVNPQEPKWIPCTERMPEESGLYLVSGKGIVWICEMLNLMGLKGWCGGLKEPIVEAWMPLPKPYEPQESEET